MARALSRCWIAAALAALLAGRAAAQAVEPASFEALPGLVGGARSDLVEVGDTLLDVAFRNRVGFELLERQNPGVDRWIPTPGTVVQLPTRAIPPLAEPRGLVINLPEMRLYDFGVAAPDPEILHVAIGDAIDPTLLGRYRIGQKRVNPAWRVPESIRREKPHLPSVVPPGPENPLGDYWMTIGTTSYGIHGTNNPWSIGREATHGCVRLYADEMERLFERTPSGTPVELVYQPVKWGRQGDGVFLEAHPDLYARMERPLDEALALPRRLGLLEGLDLRLVARVLAEARGRPVRVGTRPEVAHRTRPAGAHRTRPAAPAATSGSTW